MKRTPIRALTQVHLKSFRFYLKALKNGAVAVCGVMGDFQRGQRRAFGWELNSLKCPELGQHLYTWFIDCVPVLRCRVDASILMRHACFFKAETTVVGL